MQVSYCASEKISMTSSKDTLVMSFTPLAPMPCIKAIPQRG